MNIEGLGQIGIRNPPKSFNPIDQTITDSRLAAARHGL
jgi:hypothetical protein